jgi:hypothetical protein
VAALVVFLGAGRETAVLGDFLAGAAFFFFAMVA